MNFFSTHVYKSLILVTKLHVPKIDKTMSKLLCDSAWTLVLAKNNNLLKRREYVTVTFNLRENIIKSSDEKKIYSDSHYTICSFHFTHGTFQLEERRFFFHVLYWLLVRCYKNQRLKEDNLALYQICFAVGKCLLNVHKKETRIASIYLILVSVLMTLNKSFISELLLLFNK